RATTRPRLRSLGLRRGGRSDPAALFLCPEAGQKARMSYVQIVPFRPDHAAAWKALNEAWLAEGGFAVEARDRKVIDDPRTTILDGGGRIFIAEKDGAAIGCCALMAMDDGGFEVAKMTVAPAARGRGLGRRLLEACEA